MAAGRRNTWRVFARILSCAYLIQGTRLAAAANECPSDNPFTIRNQADADKLSQCGYFLGNVHVIDGAEGDIVLEGINSIGGDLIVSYTQDPPTGDLKSVSAPDLRTIEGSLQLGPHDTLQHVDLPQLNKILRSFSVSAVPELTELNAPTLGSFKGSFSLTDAPKLEAFVLMAPGDTARGGQSPLLEEGGYVRIDNVGVHNLSNVFNGYSAESIWLANLPNLNDLTIYLGDVDYFDVAGNGKLNLTIASLGHERPARRLNITGVAAMGSPCTRILATNVIFENNTAEVLPFWIKGLEELEIRNNPNLRFAIPGLTPSSSDDWSLREVTITDNPKLRLAQQVDDPIVESCGDVFKGKTYGVDSRETWIFDWDVLQHMELHADIEPRFFVHLTDDGFNSKSSVYVDVSIMSTDPGFSCDMFNALRSNTGFLGGDYSCQNETVSLDRSDDSYASLTAPWTMWAVVALAWTAAMCV
ncbi:hypothetical protein jhhlp_004840 [Lomentospora prolificans]|uniref:Receptor L-domain domain-containing protein n=1 Tax=Lomentospora prolificans TaxID=41688 RepID=A0A2N3N7T3_9PEZI|nr:hypothetical protein jhhlp_004840 [Lomentospora prolificans]